MTRKLLPLLTLLALTATAQTNPPAKVDFKSWLSDLPIIESFTYTRTFTSQQRSPITYFVRMQPGAQLVAVQDRNMRRVASRVGTRHVVAIHATKLGAVMQRYDSNNGSQEDILHAKAVTEGVLAEVADGLGLGMQLPTGVVRWNGDAFTYTYLTKTWKGTVTKLDKGLPSVLVCEVSNQDADDPRNAPAVYTSQMTYGYGAAGVPPDFPSQIVTAQNHKGHMDITCRYHITMLRTATEPMPESAFDVTPFVKGPVSEMFAEGTNAFIRMASGKTNVFYLKEPPGMLHVEKEKRSKTVYYALAGLILLWPACLLLLYWRKHKRAQQTRKE